MFIAAINKIASFKLFTIEVRTRVVFKAAKNPVIKQ